MIKRDQPYIRQIHVCINNRNGESPSCGYSGSERSSKSCEKSARNAILRERFAWYGAAVWTFVPSVPI